MPLPCPLSSSSLLNSVGESESVPERLRSVPQVIIPFRSAEDIIGNSEIFVFQSSPSDEASPGATHKRTHRQEPTSPSKSLNRKPPPRSLPTAQPNSEYVQTSAASATQPISKQRNPSPSSMEGSAPKKRKRIASAEDSEVTMKKKPATAPRDFKSSGSLPTAKETRRSQIPLTGPSSKPPASDLTRLEVNSQSSRPRLIHKLSSSSSRVTADSKVNAGVQDAHNPMNTAQVLRRQATSSPQSYPQLHEYPPKTPSPARRAQPAQQLSQSAANQMRQQFPSPPTMAVQKANGPRLPEGGSPAFGDPRSRRAQATPEIQPDYAAHEPAMQLTQQPLNIRQSNIQSESSSRAETYGVQHPQHRHISESTANSVQGVHRLSNVSQPNMHFRHVSGASSIGQPSGISGVASANNQYQQQRQQQQQQQQQQQRQQQQQQHQQQQQAADELYRDAQSFVTWFGKINRHPKLDHQDLDGDDCIEAIVTMMRNFCGVMKHVNDGWGPPECSRIGHAFGYNVFAVCVNNGLEDLLNQLIAYFMQEERNAMHQLEQAFFGYAGRNILRLAGVEQTPLDSLPDLTPM